MVDRMFSTIDIIEVEVAFATPLKQVIIKLECPLGTKVIDAIYQSRIQQHFPDNMIIKTLPFIGIFGKKIDPETYQLQNFDRIEIYRSLIKSPNQKRLERAKKK